MGAKSRVVRQTGQSLSLAVMSFQATAMQKVNTDCSSMINLSIISQQKIIHLGLFQASRARLWAQASALSSLNLTLELTLLGTRLSPDSRSINSNGYHTTRR